MKKTDQRAARWVLLLSLFASMAVISVMTGTDNASNGLTIGAAPRTSNADRQQPEHGLWGEYVEITWVNGSVYDTKWFLYVISDINATHYRADVTYVEDNVTTRFQGYYEVNRATGIAETVVDYYPILGQPDPVFITNATSIGDVHGPKALYGSPDTFNVTGAGTDPTFGDYAVLQGQTTNNGTTAWYLNGSGMLLNVFSTHPMSYTELRLTRTNLFDIPGYVPEFLTDVAWLRADLGWVNLTDGVMYPFMSQEITLDRLDATTYNATIDAIGLMGEDQSVERITFNITSDTITRTMIADANGPPQFNETGNTMGLDFLYIDRTFLHAGQVVACSFFPDDGISVLPFEVAGTEIFRGRLAWRLDTIPGTRFSSTIWFDDATGMVLRMEGLFDNILRVLEVVADNWLDPAFSIEQPADGSWLDYGGFIMNYYHDLNTSLKDPIYIAMSFSSIDDASYLVSTTMARSMFNATGSNQRALVGTEGTSVVLNKTGNVFNSTTQALWPCDNATGFGGKFYQVPSTIALGTYILVPFGPASMALGQVMATDEARDLATCIRVDVVVLNENGDGDHELMTGSIWFDAGTGLLHEVLVEDGMDVTAHFKRLNNGNVMQPPDGASGHAEGFSAGPSGENEWYYSPMVQDWEFHAVNDTHYDTGLTVHQYNGAAMEAPYYSSFSGYFTVRNETNWIIYSSLPFWESVNSTIKGFNPSLLGTASPQAGDWVPISMGPEVLAYITYVGDATIKGVPCWEYALVPDVHEGTIASVYFSQATGLLMQMNWTEQHGTFFLQMVREDLSGAAVPIPVHDGAWFQVAGAQHQVVTGDDPREDWEAMLVWGMIWDNGDGTFTSYQDGVYPNQNRSQFMDVVDASTLAILSTNVPWINESTHWGHFTSQIPVDVHEGDMYLVNFGPSLNVPFIVTGSGAHHGRDVWILQLHEGLRVYSTNVSMDSTLDAELWFYKDTGLIARLEGTSTGSSGGNAWVSTIVFTTIYSSFDVNPNPMYDGLWIEAVAHEFVNGSTTPSTAYPIAYESRVTGVDTCDTRMFVFERGEDDDMFNYWYASYDNVTRFISSITGPGNFPDPSEIVFTDFMKVPTTLEIGDTFYLFTPGSQNPAAIVVDIRNVECWLGTRNAIIIESALGDVIAAYDATTGILLLLNFTKIDDGNNETVLTSITLANTNLLDPLQRIDVSQGTNATFSGYSIEYKESDTWFGTIDLTWGVVSNDGTQTVMETWMSMYGGIWGWQRYESMNNRLLWLDSIDPAIAPHARPNVTGAATGPNPLYLYPTVNIGDLYFVQFGPQLELLSVTSTSTMFEGIECVELQDNTGLVTAYYRLSDKLLVYYAVNNKTYDDRSTIMALYNVDLVQPHVSPSFACNTTVIVEGKLVEFHDTSSVSPGGGDIVLVSWLWQNGTESSRFDGNPGLTTFPAPGTYELRMLVGTDAGHFGVAMMQVTVVADQLPVANFFANVTNVLEWMPIQFTFNGDTGNEPASFTWDFGDGSPVSNEMHPVHAYDGAGMYTVTLTVRDVDGDVDVLTWDNYISITGNSIPVVTFTANATSILPGGTVAFTFTGDAGDLPSTFQWDLGDGSANSTLVNPVHMYAAPGWFTVTLTVLDLNGDVVTTTIVDYIFVDGTPVASFTGNATSILAGQAVTFTFTGELGNEPASFQWDFGDGTANATVQDPVHVFSTAGNFTVTLTVRDADGDEDTFSWANYIFVQEIPVALFSGNVTTIVEGMEVGFTFEGLYGRHPTSFQWDFGDGTANASVENPVHAYTMPGTYNVTLTLEDDNGQVDTLVRVNYITVLAEANIVITSVVVSGSNGPGPYVGGMSFTVTVTYSNTGGTGATVDSTLTFGNYTHLTPNDPAGVVVDAGASGITQAFMVTTGIMATSQAQVNITATPVCIEVISARAFSADNMTGNVQIIANIAPVTSFTFSPLDPTAGANVVFTDTSTDADGTVVAWAWEFGDGETSTARNPVHVYTTAGTYVVRLTVTDNLGKTATTTQNVVVKAQPPPDIPGFSVAFLAIAMIGIVVLMLRRSWNGRTEA